MLSFTVVVAVDNKRFNLGMHLKTEAKKLKVCWCTSTFAAERPDGSARKRRLTLSKSITPSLSVFLSNAEQPTGRSLSLLRIF